MKRMMCIAVLLGLIALLCSCGSHVVEGSEPEIASFGTSVSGESALSAAEEASSAGDTAGQEAPEAAETGTPESETDQSADGQDGSDAQTPQNGETAENPEAPSDPDGAQPAASAYSLDPNAPWTGAYQTVLDQYTVVCDSKYREENDWSELTAQYPLVNENAPFFVFNYQQTLSFAIQDLNGDGKEELIVSSGDGDQALICGIYTYDGDQPVCLINDLWERNFLTVYTDGTMMRFGSGGAFYHEEDYFCISPDGMSLDQLEHFVFDYSEDSDTPCRRESDGMYFSEEDYRQMYQYMVETSFSWTPFLTW